VRAERDSSLSEADLDPPVVLRWFAPEQRGSVEAREA
jgi:hypothetical protein